MIFTVSPEDVPSPPAVVSLTVTVFVASSSPPTLQAAVPSASTRAATIEKMSRLRDIPYLLS